MDVWSTPCLKSVIAPPPDFGSDIKTPAYLSLDIIPPPSSTSNLTSSPCFTGSPLRLYCRSRSYCKRHQYWKGWALLLRRGSVMNLLLLVHPDLTAGHTVFSCSFFYGTLFWDDEATESKDICTPTRVAHYRLDYRLIENTLKDALLEAKLYKALDLPLLI